MSQLSTSYPNFRWADCQAQAWSSPFEEAQAALRILWQTEQNKWLNRICAVRECQLSELEREFNSPMQGHLTYRLQGEPVLHLWLKFEGARALINVSVPADIAEASKEVIK